MAGDRARFEAQVGRILDFGGEDAMDDEDGEEQHFDAVIFACSAQGVNRALHGVGEASAGAGAGDDDDADDDAAAGSIVIAIGTGVVVATGDHWARRRPLPSRASTTTTAARRCRPSSGRRYSSRTDRSGSGPSARRTSNSFLRHENRRGGPSGTSTRRIWIGCGGSPP